MPPSWHVLFQHLALTSHLRTCTLMAPCAQVEGSLRAALQGLAAEMGTWAKDEALWQRTWRALVAQVEGL